MEKSHFWESSGRLPYAIDLQAGAPGNAAGRTEWPDFKEIVGTGKGLNAAHDNPEAMVAGTGASARAKLLDCEIRCPDRGSMPKPADPARMAGDSQRLAQPYFLPAASCFMRGVNDSKHGVVP